MKKPKYRDAKIRCNVHGDQPCECTLRYKLFGELNQLPSYGLIAGGDDVMISRKAALALLDDAPPKQPTRQELGEDFC